MDQQKATINRKATPVGRIMSEDKKGAKVYLQQISKTKFELITITKESENSLWSQGPTKPIILQKQTKEKLGGVEIFKVTTHGPRKMNSQVRDIEEPQADGQFILPTTHNMDSTNVADTKVGLPKKPERDTLLPEDIIMEGEDITQEFKDAQELLEAYWPNNEEVRKMMNLSIEELAIQLKTGLPDSIDLNSVNDVSYDPTWDEEFTKRETQIIETILTTLIEADKINREAIFTAAKNSLQHMMQQSQTIRYNLQIREAIQKINPTFSANRLVEIQEECARRHQETIKSTIERDVENITRIIQNRHTPLKGMIDAVRKRIPMMPKECPIVQSQFAKHALDAAMRCKQSIHIIFTRFNTVSLALSHDSMPLIMAPNPAQFKIIKSCGLLAVDRRDPIFGEEDAMLTNHTFQNDIRPHRILSHTVRALEATAILFARAAKVQVHLIFNGKNELSLATSDQFHRIHFKLNPNQQKLWDELSQILAKKIKHPEDTLLIPPDDYIAQQEYKHLEDTQTNAKLVDMLHTLMHQINNGIVIRPVHPQNNAHLLIAGIGGNKSISLPLKTTKGDHPLLCGSPNVVTENKRHKSK